MGLFEQFSSEARQERRARTCAEITDVISTELTERAQWPRSASVVYHEETVQGRRFNQAAASNKCGAVFYRTVGEQAVQFTCYQEGCALMEKLDAEAAEKASLMEEAHDTVGNGAEI